MSSRLLIIAVSILVILILIRWLIARRKVKENITHKSYKILGTVLVIGIIATALYTMLMAVSVHITNNPGLQDKYPSVVVTVAETFEDIVEPGNELTINVRQNSIIIGNYTYHNVDSVRTVLQDRNAEELSIVLIDDYAMRNTYQSVYSTLLECGIKEENITQEQVD